MILLCFKKRIHVGFCLNMLVLSSLVSTIVIAMVVYVCVGRRFKNKGEVLLAYGRVCFGAFKHQHRLSKVAQCTFNSIYLKENNVKIFTV